jgi:hypothetical protein
MSTSFFILVIAVAINIFSVFIDLLITIFEKSQSYINAALHVFPKKGQWRSPIRATQLVDVALDNVARVLAGAMRWSFL